MVCHFYLFLGYADAGIGDLEAQQIAGVGLLDQASRQRDAAADDDFFPRLYDAGGSGLPAARGV